MEKKRKQMISSGFKQGAVMANLRKKEKTNGLVGAKIRLRGGQT